MKNFILAILIITLIACDAINAQYCLGGPNRTGQKIDGKPVLKEGKQCYLLSKDEVLALIPCPPLKKKQYNLK